jgi:magnesium chelatase family protein
MSLAVVLSRGLAGLDAPLVTVEVHLAGGLPAFNLVGLPDTEVKESRDRVRAALQNAQFDFPARKITVNLAPADLPKESGRYDLPIAIGVLAATGQIPATRSLDTSSRASSRWVERCGRSAAHCPWRFARGATAARSCCRRRAQPRRRSCAMRSCIRRLRCYPSADI